MITSPGFRPARAGLKPGDVITALGGETVHRAGDVSTRVGLARPGDRLTLAVWRDKARRDIPVSLGKAESEKAAPAAQSEGASLGLSVRPLDRDEMRQAGIDHGLLIEGVNGPAQWAGIEPGDVLLALNGRPVHKLEQVREALRKHPKQVALLVARDGQQIFVPVDLG